MLDYIKSFIQSDTFKRYLSSSVQTFLASFLLTFGYSIKDATALTGAALVSLAITSLRVAIKAVWEYWFERQ